jgi:hypothetical protein
MKTYGAVDVQIQIFLTSALVGGEWSASRLGRFTPEKKLRYPLNRRLGGPQRRSERRGEEKILVPTGTRTPSLCRLRYPSYLHIVFVKKLIPSYWRIYTYSNPCLWISSFTNVTCMSVCMYVYMYECVPRGHMKVGRTLFVFSVKSFPLRHRLLLHESNILAPKIGAVKLGLREQNRDIFQAGSNDCGHIA